MTDDLTERAKAALEATNCTDDMQDFFRVGLVRELLAEVERLRGALDRVRERADRAASIKAWSDGDGPTCDEANGINAVGEDILRLIEAALRGDQC